MEVKDRGDSHSLCFNLHYPSSVVRQKVNNRIIRHLAIPLHPSELLPQDPSLKRVQTKYRFIIKFTAHGR